MFYAPWGSNPGRILPMNPLGAPRGALDPTKANPP